MEQASFQTVSKEVQELHKQKAELKTSIDQSQDKLLELQAKERAAKQSLELAKASVAAQVAKEQDELDKVTQTILQQEVELISQVNSAKAEQQQGVTLELESRRKEEEDILQQMLEVQLASATFTAQGPSMFQQYVNGDQKDNAPSSRTFRSKSKFLPIRTIQLQLSADKASLSLYNTKSEKSQSGKARRTGQPTIVPISDIKAVFYGQRSPTFQKRLDATHEKWLCISFVTAAETYDLQALDSQGLQAQDLVVDWFQAIHALTSTRPWFRGKILFRRTAMRIAGSSGGMGALIADAIRNAALEQEKEAELDAFLNPEDEEEEEGTEEEEDVQ